MEEELLKDKLTLIILGRSGSGKGTQAKNILERLNDFGANHLETGRFFRDFLKTHDNVSAEIAREILGAGKLMPDWFAAYAILREILEKGIAENHWVMDGAPRTLGQARLIDDIAKWHKRALPLCLYVEVGAAEVAKRLNERGRVDDTPESIENRMDFFDKEVLPLVDYYRNENRLLKINGEQSEDSVWAEIDSALSENLKEKWPKSVNFKTNNEK